MISEELRIVIRAEAQSAIEELTKFKTHTEDATASMRKFARQLLGPLGVGYAVREVARFMKESVGAYYTLTGEVNKQAEAFKTMKAGIGSLIVNNAFYDWLTDVTVKASDAVGQVTNLRQALKDLALDASLPASTAIDIIKKQLEEVNTALTYAKGPRAFLGLAAVTDNSAEIARLESAKQYWELELARQQVELMVQKGREALAAGTYLGGPGAHTYGTVLGTAMGMQLGGLGNTPLFPLGPAWGATPAGELNTADLGIPSFTTPFAEQLRNTRLSEASGLFQNAMQEAALGRGWQMPSKEETDPLQGIFDSMTAAMKEGAMTGFVEAMNSLGQVASGAQDLGQALNNILANISNQTAQIFLMAAMRSFADPKIPTEVGIGFLVLAGITGFLGGAIGSLPSSRSYARSATTTGRGSVYGVGENIQNPTGAPIVVQNIAGSVIEQDKLLAIAQTGARSLNSGR
jgi:hypothetical protein